MDKSNEDIVSIEALKDYHFLVEDYQRGYKWGLQQVHELLTDILEFERGGNESFYCLQPLVVKPIKENTYELIDGQQRLTTIFIILKCLKENIYSITYRTRESSEAFLNEITQINGVAGIDVQADLDTQITPMLQKAWTAYAKDFEEDDIDNVDNYHFYCAYQYIKAWLDYMQESRQYFKTNLLEYVKIIWYQHKGEENPEEVFIKFNQGKIELAQAELIKALFVLQLNEEKNVELRSFKLNQFAEEWNFIENQLQDDTFWLFVSNDTSDNKKSNRIDLLFDLIREKPASNNDELYSYHKYLQEFKDHRINNDQERLNWQEINELFNQLYEWYHDRHLYHLIGFIVFEGITTISQLKKDYEETLIKSEFVEGLKRAIYSYLYGDKAKDKFNLETVTYGGSNKQIETILVLHNIINYYYTDNYYRFPFDRLKKEQGWSLEHIHAQNTDLFESISQIESWLRDIEALADNFSREKELNKDNLEVLQSRIAIVRSKTKEEGVSGNDRELKRLVRSLDESVSSYFNKDSLSNLCLLDRRTNSSVGNLFFNEKREKILNIDKMTLEEYNKEYEKSEKIKPYIPISTKHVFLKYFTSQGDVNMTFWGSIDRDDYLQNIQSSIEKFLKTEAIV
ncbi:DUF262 domain-containing protein [Winogradskyella algicola]|uniref:DUF262 domain-containing protein n=1 Tax=Winogradskyella algicola TaxID=2575815 RepID=UPI001109F162|nr:DUF262 domain-containing protein [Winogradskyella algicola]